MWENRAPVVVKEDNVDPQYSRHYSQYAQYSTIVLSILSIFATILSILTILIFWSTLITHFGGQCPFPHFPLQCDQHLVFL